jgi:hypothetical protein
MFDDDISGSLRQRHGLSGSDVRMLVKEKTEQHQNGGL